MFEEGWNHQSAEVKCVKYCQWCDEGFDGPARQIYCSSECREEATKYAAAKKRVERRRRRRASLNKKCKVCGARLSMYGDGDVCAAHNNDTRSFMRFLMEVKSKI